MGNQITITLYVLPKTDLNPKIESRKVDLEQLSQASSRTEVDRILCPPDDTPSVPKSYAFVSHDDFLRCLSAFILPTGELDMDLAEHLSHHLLLEYAFAGENNTMTIRAFHAKDCSTIVNAANYTLIGEKGTKELTSPVVSKYVTEEDRKLFDTLMKTPIVLSTRIQPNERLQGAGAYGGCEHKSETRGFQYEITQNPAKFLKHNQPFTNRQTIVLPLEFGDYLVICFDSFNPQDQLNKTANVNAAAKIKNAFNNDPSIKPIIANLLFSFKNKPQDRLVNNTYDAEFCYKSPPSKEKIESLNLPKLYATRWKARLTHLEEENTRALNNGPHINRVLNKRCILPLDHIEAMKRIADSRGSGKDIRGASYGALVISFFEALILSDAPGYQNEYRAYLKILWDHLQHDQKKFQQCIERLLDIRLKLLCEEKQTWPSQYQKLITQDGVSHKEKANIILRHIMAPFYLDSAIRGGCSLYKKNFDRLDFAKYHLFLNKKLGDFKLNFSSILDAICNDRKSQPSFNLFNFLNNIKQKPDLIGPANPITTNDFNAEQAKFWHEYFIALANENYGDCKKLLTRAGTKGGKQFSRNPAANALPTTMSEKGKDNANLFAMTSPLLGELTKAAAGVKLNSPDLENTSIEFADGSHQKAPITNLVFYLAARLHQTDAGKSPQSKNLIDHPWTSLGNWGGNGKILTQEQFACLFQEKVERLQELYKEEKRNTVEISKLENELLESASKYPNILAHFIRAPGQTDAELLISFLDPADPSNSDLIAQRTAWDAAQQKLFYAFLENGCTKEEAARQLTQFMPNYGTRPLSQSRELIEKMTKPLLYIPETYTFMELCLKMRNFGYTLGAQEIASLTTLISLKKPEELTHGLPTINNPMNLGYSLSSTAMIKFDNQIASLKLEHVFRGNLWAITPVNAVSALFLGGMVLYPNEYISWVAQVYHVCKDHHWTAFLKYYENVGNSIIHAIIDDKMPNFLRSLVSHLINKNINDQQPENDINLFFNTFCDYFGLPLMKHAESLTTNDESHVLIDGYGFTADSIRNIEKLQQSFRECLTTNKVKLIKKIIDTMEKIGSENSSPTPAIAPKNRPNLFNENKPLEKLASAGVATTPCRRTWDYLGLFSNRLWGNLPGRGAMNYWNAAQDDAHGTGAGRAKKP